MTPSSFGKIDDDGFRLSTYSLNLISSSRLNRQNNTNLSWYMFAEDI